MNLEKKGNKIKTPWNKRLHVLKEIFSNWLETVPEKTVTVEKIFFNHGC